MIMQVDEELGAPVLKRQPVEAATAPQDLPMTSGINLTPKASTLPTTRPKMTSDEVTRFLQEDIDRRNALILEIKLEEEERLMQIQEDEEEERAQALTISLLSKNDAGPSGSKLGDQWALVQTLTNLET